MKFLLNWLIYSLSIYISASILPGVTISGFWVTVLIAAVLGILNTFIKPLLILLTLPLNILTLGLFTFIINAVIILLAAEIVDEFAVENFWWALLMSIILSIVNSILFSLSKD